MSTAEFMIGRSADDAIERKKELRKIGLALLAAVLLHLVVGVGIALSHGFFGSNPVVEEDKPLELTIVETTPPPPTESVKKNSMFMETDPAQQSLRPPDEATFESNADSVAAAEKTASGNLPIPSQDGVERPFVDLHTQAYTPDNQGAQPQPTPQATPAPSASAAPSVEPSVTPAVDQLAMLRPTPTPQPSVAPTQPARVASNYHPMKEQTRLQGAISRRGVSAVNAKGTPLGRYQKQVYDTIGANWYMYVEKRMEMINVGTARVSFLVDRSGKVRNLKVLQNSSNETFANVCIQSVMAAKLPAIPEDVASTLPVEGLDNEITFNMTPQ